MNGEIPPGFEQCPVCGEFNGATKAKYLTWETEPPARVGAVEVPEGLRQFAKKARADEVSSRDPERIVTVSCLCKGPLCKTCGVNRIHRPISNAYDRNSNTVGHWSHLIGMFPCRPCREEAEQARSLKFRH